MKRMTIDEFLELSGTEITKDEILGKSRRRRISTARQAYWCYLNIQGVGHRRISKIDGRRKQTISSGIRTVKGLLDTNDILIEPYKEILKIPAPSAD